jgi:hypothetical protein
MDEPSGNLDKRVAALEAEVERLKRQIDPFHAIRGYAPVSDKTVELIPVSDRDLETVSILTR